MSQRTLLLLIPSLGLAQACIPRGTPLPPGRIVLEQIWSICGRDADEDRHDLTSRAPHLERIANSPIAAAQKASELRDALPDAAMFLDYYFDLCWVASLRQISDTAYHLLLDSVVPFAVTDADSFDQPPPLSAPTVRGPPDHAVLDRYPRRTTLSWSRVNGAHDYLVEVEVLIRGIFWLPQEDLPFSVTRDTSYTFNFVGAQPGRWRVRALDSLGFPGTVSAWRYFTYLR
jgi:hypothetical protein